MSLQLFRDIAPKSCLKAAGLTLLMILSGAPAVLVFGGGLVGWLFGQAAVRVFETNVFSFYMWTWQLIFMLAPVALAACLAVVTFGRLRVRVA